MLFVTNEDGIGVGRVTVNVYVFEALKLFNEVVVSDEIDPLATVEPPLTNKYEVPEGQKLLMLIAFDTV
jgi:hypothetical protein